MYSGTRVCAGQAHWQSTTLWKYCGLRMSVGCTQRLLSSAGASDLPASPVGASLPVSRKSGRVVRRVVQLPNPSPQEQQTLQTEDGPRRPFPCNVFPMQTCDRITKSKWIPALLASRASLAALAVAGTMANEMSGGGDFFPRHKQKRASRPVSVNPWKPSDYTLAASSSVTAFIDSRMRPCLSTSSTLTLTTSPSFSLSETFSTRSLEICDTCTRPSLPGRMVTNAPKSISLTTLPS